MKCKICGSKLAERNHEGECYRHNTYEFEYFIDNVCTSNVNFVREQTIIEYEGCLIDE